MVARSKQGRASPPDAQLGNQAQCCPSRAVRRWWANAPVTRGESRGAPSKDYLSRPAVSRKPRVSARTSRPSLGRRSYALWRIIRRVVYAHADRTAGQFICTVRVQERLQPCDLLHSGIKPQVVIFADQHHRPQVVQAGTRLLAPVVMMMEDFSMIFPSALSQCFHMAASAKGRPSRSRMRKGPLQ